MCRLLARLLGRPEPEAREAVLRSATALPLADRERVLWRAVLERVASPLGDESTRAFDAALRRLELGEVDALLAAVGAGLARRRGARELIAHLECPLSSRHVDEARRRVALGAVELLAADPLAVPLYLKLARHLREGDLRRRILDLAQRDLLHMDALRAACDAVAAAHDRDWLDRQLGGETDPRLRRIGLAALEAAAGRKDGWTADRRARLLQYRADTHPSVAGAAAYVFPPE